MPGNEQPTPQHNPYDIIPETPPEARDKEAEKEEQFFSGDDRRREELKEHLHWFIVLGLKAAAIAVIGMFLVRIFHLVLPATWRWLTPEELSQMDHLLFSGALGGIIGRYMQEILPGSSKKKSLSEE